MTALDEWAWLRFELRRIRHTLTDLARRVEALEPPRDDPQPPDDPED